MIKSENSPTFMQTLGQLDIQLLTRPVDPARLGAVMHQLLLQPLTAGKA